MRNKVKVVLAIAVGLGALGITAPAQAADNTGDCSAPSGSINLNVGRFVGDIYTWLDGSGSGSGCTISNSGTSGVVTWSSSNGSDTPSTNPTTLSQGATLTVSMVTAGTEVLTLTGPGRTYTITFNVTGGGGGGGGESSSSTTLRSSTPVVQAFGKLSNDSCNALASDELNWSGVTSGGWSESWGRWEGYEGPVCTRNLIYSTSQSQWIVE